ncbi:universal stress protein [Subtercola boreus]|uniref:universal stress protein n=1 Tax=Subtercola boreus TaxID=120213 RepID=UPI00263ACC56|nr:universal stress protein [Subtercola boreus]
MGVDGSAASVSALRRGIVIARALQVPLQAIIVWRFPTGVLEVFPSDYSPEQDAVDQLTAVTSAVFEGSPPDDLIQTAIEGYPAEVLIEISSDAAMLIVGSRGRGEVASLILGSVSAECAEKAHCPVLVMHGTSAAESAQNLLDVSTSDATATASTAGH